ncbi:hypothetical protein [Trichloromonas sp.]|uniref:hypothetical protein n=1 Tax=Trichloromonas sp. TaxID=3069249 RepID=UPI002A45401B|nr:hypothetical protein [Trichloromonas sp.]
MLGSGSGLLSGRSSLLGSGSGLLSGRSGLLSGRSGLLNGRGGLLNGRGGGSSSFFLFFAGDQGHGQHQAQAQGDLFHELTFASIFVKYVPQAAQWRTLRPLIEKSREFFGVFLFI